MKANIKTTLVCLLVTGLSGPPLCRAQNTNIPAPNTLYNTSTGTGWVTREIDNLLKAGPGEMMAGISGYDLNVGDLISEYVEKEIRKAIAEAVGEALVYAPVGVPVTMEMYDAFISEKNNELAEEIDKVKRLMKDAMSRNIKSKYQEYAVQYEKFASKARQGEAIKNSIRNAGLKQDITTLFGDFAKVTGVYYYPSSNQKIFEQGVDPSLTFAMTAAAIDLNNGDALRSKQALSSAEFDPSDRTSTELVAMTPYERMKLRQQVSKEVMKRKRALMAIVASSNANMKYKFRKLNQKSYSQQISLPSTKL
ncbi:hypothetical protein [Spirosoma endophyticum]|uniref:Uncharacterized protein n=1 Tax=Spirosoma endophyticum TaxID=662367 RepID=A0A1I2BKX7_9BACT|nr:hypothetical protein [Spirosoma endophyticum]SFE55890.1 hypothetical protein SAMN05216167_115111 [Spirosoma endophyticum]